MHLSKWESKHEKTGRQAAVVKKERLEDDR
jgi:hypothetical protein